MVSICKVIPELQQEISQYASGAGDMFKCYNESCGVWEIVEFWRKGDSSNLDDSIECHGCKQQIYYQWCHPCDHGWACSEEFAMNICGRCETAYCDKCNKATSQCYTCNYHVCYPNCVAAGDETEGFCYVCFEKE